MSATSRHDLGGAIGCRARAHGDRRSIWRELSISAPALADRCLRLPVPITGLRGHVGAGTWVVVPTRSRTFLSSRRPLEVVVLLNRLGWVTVRHSRLTLL